MLPIVVAVSACLLAVAGCGKSDTGAGTAKKPPLVKAVPARMEALTDWLRATGDVAATNAVTISATVEGPIAFCPWREGDTVEKGRTLIQIDRPVYREEVNASEATLHVAEAKLADLRAGARPEEIAQAAEAVKQLEECAGFAESDMKRTDQMVKSGSLPGESLEKARVLYVKCKTQLVAAQEKLQMLKAGPTATAIAVQEALVQEAAARLEKAKATLTECTVLAPFPGVITRVYVRPGDLATAKAPLLDLMERDSLVVRFGVPEAQSAAVRQGAKVKLTFDALPGREFDASVSRVFPELDPKTRTRLAEAEIAADVGAAPGMFARVAVAVRTVENAVVVPDGAVLTTPQGGRAAFVVNGDKAALRPLKIGLEAGGRVQVVEGIQPGEQVIVAGHEALKDGAPVRVPGSAQPASSAEGQR
jgi:multidrug efflux pump subunit AcrA (membrane-fusion protein)